MDATTLAAELSARPAPIWRLIDLDETTRWTFGDPEVPHRFGDFRSQGELSAPVDIVEPGPARDRQLAYAFAGSSIRLTVPGAAQTAGQHWLLSNPGKGGHLRLSVGRSWTLSIRWAPDFFEGGFRISRSSVAQAVAAGVLDAKEVASRGIEEMPDGVQVLAGDAVRYQCPDEEALVWFLYHPAIVSAARIMNVRLMAAGGFAWASAYKPELVAEAWAAAELFVYAPDSPTPPRGPAFHRPYTGRPAVGAFPPQQATNPEAHERAEAEHHDLTTRLLAYLVEAGLAAGLRDDVPVDLAWDDHEGDLTIAEIKSCFGNDVSQLRTGLAQLVEYRERLVSLGEDASCILLVSHVEDDTWYAICDSVDVTLIAADVPDDWTALLVLAADDDALIGT